MPLSRCLPSGRARRARGDMRGGGAWRARRQRDRRSRIARWISRCCCRIASPSIEAPIVSISDGCRTSSVQLVKARSSSFRAVLAITRWKRVSAARNASEAGWFPSASAIAASRSRAVASVACCAARPASGTSRWTRASTSSTSETLSVSSITAIDSLTLRRIPSLCVLSTKIPPPGPCEARIRCELASRRSPSRRVGRLTPNSAASSCSVPRRSPGRRPRVER